RVGWLAVLLALLAVVPFLPVLGNDFVGWDDNEILVNNPDCQGLGWAQVQWAATTFHMGIYQPLGWLILGAQAAAGDLAPAGYHLVSLVLHALNAAVLFLLVVTLLARCQPRLRRERPWVLLGGAALAVAGFMVHPLRTEVVAWVSCQSYLPCTLFAMLALLAYLRAHGAATSRRRRWVLGCLLLQL